MGSATQKKTLEQLAETADRIMEYSVAPSPHVSAIDSGASTSTNPTASPPIAIEAIAGHPPNSFLLELNKTLANIGDQLKRLSEKKTPPALEQKSHTRVVIKARSVRVPQKIRSRQTFESQMLGFLSTPCRMGEGKNSGAKKRIVP